MNDDELQEMIDEADRDGDGEISEEEFIRIMKKTNLFWLMKNLNLMIWWEDSLKIYKLCW